MNYLTSSESDMQKKLKNISENIQRMEKAHKDYKCESCGKSFSHANNLKTHIHTIHEGHKDYKCESCGKSFSHAGHLMKHIHTIHKIQ